MPSCSLIYLLISELFVEEYNDKFDEELHVFWRLIYDDH